MEGSLADRIVLSLVIIVGALIIFRRRGAAVGVLKNNKALLAFTIYLGITVFWSDIAGISFKRWVRLVGNIVMAAVLITEPDPVEAIRSVFRRAAYLLIPLSILLIKYFPTMGVLYTRLGGLIWTGVALMKNGLAHLCLVMTMFLIWELTRSKAKMNVSRIFYDVIVLMMGLWLLRGTGSSYSSAAIGCLILGLSILLGSRVEVVKRNFGKIGVITVMTVCLFLLFEYSIGIVEMIVTSLGRDMTFTDRVPLWNALIELGMRKPLLGYGYEGFWTEGRLALIDSIAGSFSQAHSGYLETFVEGGLVAIVLLTVLLIAVYKKIQRIAIRDYEQAVFRLSFLAMILLANVTESSFARSRDLLTFVFYIIAMDYGSHKMIPVELPNKIMKRINQHKYGLNRSAKVA